MMHSFLALVVGAPVEQHAGADPTPTEAADSLLTNLYTGVLATVRCGGWKSNWCNGFMGLLFSTFLRCSNVTICAVKGGECPRPLSLHSHSLSRSFVRSFVPASTIRGSSPVPPNFGGVLYCIYMQPHPRVVCVRALQALMRGWYSVLHAPLLGDTCAYTQGRPLMPRS